MKRIICILLSVILLSGCASRKTPKLAEVNYENGVSKEEAKLIAKQYLSKSKYKRKFQAATAGFLSSKETWECPDIWFVMFSPNKMKLIEYKHIVGVDKNTGEITFEGTLSPSGLSSFIPY